MDRKNFFHGQAVQAADVNGAFDQVVKRFQDAYVDSGSHGIARTPYRSGTTELTVLEAAIPNLTTTVKPGAAYTKEGDRLNVDTDQSVDVSVDVDSNSTIPSVGNQRYISIFALPEFSLTDLRTDPINGGTVAFNKNAIAKFEVIAGAEAASNPPLPALRNDAVLLADILLANSTTAVTNAADPNAPATGEIDLRRREQYTLRSKILQADYGLSLPKNFGQATVVPNNFHVFREAIPVAWVRFDGNQAVHATNPLTLKSSFNIVKVLQPVSLSNYVVQLPDGLFSSADSFCAVVTAGIGNTPNIIQSQPIYSAPTPFVAVHTVDAANANDTPDDICVLIFGRPNLP